jgi:hypothetical protein
VSVISESPKEVELIVSEIYKDYPLSVQKAALNSTILHLEKLLLEGDVVFKDGKYYMS